MMLDSMKIDSKALIGNFHVVCAFPEVFSKDINSFPHECEFNILIDLVLGNRPISMVLYRMPTS